MRSTRLVIADRHPIVLHGLTSVFAEQRDFVIVASCSDGASCIEAIRSLAPDVAMLDSMSDLYPAGVFYRISRSGRSRCGNCVRCLQYDFEVLGARTSCSVPAANRGWLELAASLLDAGSVSEGNKRRQRECAAGADGPRKRDHASGVQGIVEQGNCAPAEHFSRHDQSAPASHLSETRNQ